MKLLLGILLMLFAGKSFGQKMAFIERRLNTALNKIDYWDAQRRNSYNEDAYDSLEASNLYFEKLLLHYTTTYPGTISYAFKTLIKSHLIIATSEDGKFRIYTWNTLGGGSMRCYKTIFQYKNSKGVFAKASADNREQEKDPPGTFGSFYYQINDVIVGNKTYYLAQHKYILSGTYAYYSLKAFSIDKRGLNENAKLIKSGAQPVNEIGYDIDWSAQINQTNNSYPDEIKYDPKKKAFTIPLVLKNHKITAKRIRYVFTGRYFEKAGLIPVKPDTRYK